MDSCAAVETNSLLNDSAIIGLIRQLLIPRPSRDSPHPGISLQSHEADDDDAWDQAGCLLWDMAAVQEHAAVMADNLILDILPELVLDHDSPDRLVEISAGILGNMACHASLQSKLSEHPQLQQSVLQGALMRDDAGCICEACRLLSSVLAGSHAESWLEATSTGDTASRVAWLLEATQNSVVLTRVCELVAAMASARASAAQLLVSSGVLAKLQIPFEDFVRTAQRAPAEQRTEWGDEGAEPDDGFPSLSAMEAVLDALESAEQVCSAAQAVSEDECGVAAMSTDEGLQQLLVQSMDDKISLLFRGRAAIMLAGLDAGSFDFFAEDDAAMMRLVQLLLDAPMSEHALAFQDAAWTHLGRALRSLQSADMGDGRQLVLEVLRSKGKGIRAAARELEEGTDHRRAKRALLVVQELHALTP